MAGKKKRKKLLKKLKRDVNQEQKSLAKLLKSRDKLERKISKQERLYQKAITRYEHASALGNHKSRQKVRGAPLEITDPALSFVEFEAEKQPGRGYHKFHTVVVYYLQQILGNEQPAIDDIQQCYEAVSKTVSADLEKRLQSTADNTGWIEVNEASFSITQAGIALVEEGLPE